VLQACDTSGRCWKIRLCDICVRIIASETPAPAPAPAGRTNRRRRTRAPVDRSRTLPGSTPVGRSGRCRSQTRRRTVPRPSTRPTRTSEAALWTRRRRGGAAGGTPGRVGEAVRASTLVLKMRSCWLNGNAPLSSVRCGFAHAARQLLAFRSMIRVGRVCRVTAMLVSRTRERRTRWVGSVRFAAFRARRRRQTCEILPVNTQRAPSGPATRVHGASPIPKPGSLRPL